MINQNPRDPQWWKPDYNKSWEQARSSMQGDSNPLDRSTMDQDESSLRYGYGARQHYNQEGTWDKVEAKLTEEWNDLKTGRTWDEVKTAVRRGWDAAKDALTPDKTRS